MVATAEAGVTLAPSSGRRPLGRSIVHVALVLAIAFGVLAGAGGYWAVVRAPELVRSPYDPAVIAAARTVPRGRIVDREGRTLARNEEDANGELYRVYRGPAISQVVGYASSRYGRAGIELAYDAELTGLATDPLTEAFRKFGAQAYDPADLTLTLDYVLQREAVEALGDFEGAVAMIDPRTGEVLALASTPTYDASDIANPDTAERTMERLRSDEDQPLLPRATLGRYVPGSVFKIVTAIAGLGSGAVSPATSYEEQPPAEEDGLRVEGFRIRDGHHPATGSEELDLIGATEASCNIWYALTGLETGGANLVDFAERLGFGAPLPFDLPTAESQVTDGDGDDPGGFVDDVELANASYGQAETFVTPLQMALVAATVANDGALMRPRIVAAMETQRGGRRETAPEQVRRVVDAGDAAAITEAMVAAVEGDVGRQFTAGAKVPGVTTAGKSGTAELGGRGEPHSWFIGFAPADAPRVAIAVLVEQGGRGGEVAAPIAGELMGRYLRTDQ
jgi:peptidoglycan glycosyltransferase